MGTASHQQTSDPSHIWITQPEGASNCYSDPGGRFSIVSTDGSGLRNLSKLDIYSGAMAFVDGKLSVHGDLFAAIRWFLNRPRAAGRDLLLSAIARFAHIPKTKATKNIRFHYDRSNEFYRQFLDARMVYSEAHFEYAGQSLDEAQFAKLDRVCRHLELKPGDRFLDVGSGWGGLIVHAAAHYGVIAEGCTLSNEQLRFARGLVEKQGLSDRVSIDPIDYRNLEGRFDKIASIGMFEHVGRSKLREYFEKIFSVLEKGGLFLNRGLIRPRGVSKGPETLFLQNEVFPGSELVHLDEVIRAGERAGFEAVGLEDVRMQYARTARIWVENLQHRAVECVRLVGDRTYRIWVLYLAAAVVSLEDLQMSAAEVVFSKP